MLKSLITSKTKRDLLVLFFTHPHKKFYLREISRKIEQQATLIGKELDMLETSNIVASEKVANLRYYYVDRKCPIYKELKRIILKTEGVEGTIRDALESQKSKISIAFIYGSYAKEKEKPCSDIDLMVIGTIRPSELVKILSKVERKLRREINYVIFPPKEFKQKLDKPFMRNVMKGKKIFIIGNEDGLKRVVERG